MENQFCPKCGQQNPGEAAFCVTCGHRLAAAANTAADAEVTAAQTTQTQVPSPSPTQPPYTAVMEMNYPKAGLGKRFLAYIADSLIGGLPLVPGFVLLGTRDMEALGGVVLLFAGCWGFFYGFFKDGFAGGQSYGKRWNGLMVVSISTNQPCTKGKSALRALAFCIPYVGGIIELVMTLAADKGRRLGDRFAGTQVIEVSRYTK